MWCIIGLGLFICGALAKPHENHGHLDHASPDQNIVGGGPVDETTRFALKYQVALAARSSGRWYVFCGGTWVDDHRHNRLKIVTAAHCVSDGNPAGIRVIIGMNNTAKLNDGSFPFFTMDHIIVHPQYNPSTLDYDVALGFVPNAQWHDVEVAIRQHTDVTVKPIIVATTDYHDYETCWVSGFGRLSSGGSSPSQLQVVEKPIWSLARCRSESSYNPTSLTDRMICSGLAGKDACQGDSGGPLVVYRQHKYKLQGIVSWGIGCAMDGYPGIYADAGAVRDWINDSV